MFKEAVYLWTFAWILNNVRGHGRLLKPPSRASMHRFKNNDSMLIPYRHRILSNFNDVGLNCGGRDTQTQLGGKCGVCGDPYNAPVKDHEAGGRFAKGIITRLYRRGQVIDVEVEITAEHKGYFEFRLCPWNNVTVPVPQECLNRYLLEFEDGTTKWYLPRKVSEATGIHRLRVRLPRRVTCDQCLLQWRYRTGNSWGTEHGRSGLGLGQQEEFYGCADVAISRTGVGRVEPPPSNVLPTSTLPVAFSSRSSEPEWRHSTLRPRPSTTPRPLPTPTPLPNRTRRPRLQTTQKSRPNSNRRKPNRRRKKKKCKKQPSNRLFFNSCTSYYLCNHGQKVVFQCPPGTKYNRNTSICDHAYNVPRPCGTAKRSKQ